VPNEKGERKMKKEKRNSLSTTLAEGDVRREKNIGFENEKNKKEKIKKAIFRDFNKNTKRANDSRNCKRNSEGTPQETLELEEITEYEGEVLEKLAETFNAGLSNSLRIKILDYCLTERSFSDIMLTLRLNPASIKHHGDLLQESELIEKIGKGKDTKYKTTPLGETLLSFVGDVLKVVRIT